MTLVTSLFNKGIYKNTLRRFKWGSFIYFIILFFSVPFGFMMRSPVELKRDYYSNSLVNENVLFSYSSFLLPMIVAIVVPTVVALLVYNYIHSGKHSVFAHSLPVTRISNYFSSILAAFTLMFLPLAANALILLVMRFAGYSLIFTITDILYWLWVNIYIIFVFFSIATFASFLTGNSFAQVGINIIMHAALPLVALTIIVFSDVFTYGYMTIQGSFAEDLITYTPIVWIFGAFANSRTMLTAFNDPAAWIYLAVGIIFYALTGILCKKRRVENCGEVAGFKIMNPILKYTVTSIVAIASFSILVNSDVPLIWLWGVPVVLCMIAYFACEMILNKTLKVFGKYKGYLAFVCVSAVVVCFFSFTSVFGFETRIPKYDEIESATIYSQYHDQTPFSSDDASKEIVIKYHNEFIKDIPVFSNDYQHRSTRKYETHTNVYIVYNLKNGKTLGRRYLVPVEMRDEAISEMFNFVDYKMTYSSLDSINIDNVKGMTLNIDAPHFSYSYALNEDAQGLLKAIENDMRNISYKDYNEYQSVEFRLSLDLSPEQNDTLKIFKQYNDDRYYNFNFVINNNFKNAMTFLEESGYMTLAIEKMANAAYISKNIYDSAKYKNREVTYVDDMKVTKEETTAIPDTEWIKLETTDGAKVIREILEDNLISFTESESDSDYLIVIAENINDVYFGSRTFAIPCDKLPEYLKKYVD